MKKFISILISAMTIIFCLIPGFTAFAANYENEKNNSYETANVISINSKITANTSNESDSDFFKITVPSNGKLNIYFNHTFSDSKKGWTMFVYMKNDNGTYDKMFSKNINLCDSEKIEVPSIGAKAGTMFCIKVVPRNFATYASVELTTAEYSISNSFTATENFEKEFNNSYETANIISKNSTVTANLISESDYDFFSFTSNHETEINVHFHHKFTDKNLGWKVSFLQKADDGTYKEIESKNIYLKDAEDYKFSTIGSKAGTKYCIKVIPINSGTYADLKYTPNDYTISFNGNSSIDNGGNSSIDDGGKISIFDFIKNILLKIKEILAIIPSLFSGIVTE